MLSSAFLLALLPLANGQIITSGSLESSLSRAQATQQTPTQVTSESEPLLVDKYIFAGTKAEPDEFPWIVKSASPTSICTGALIHEDIVLTAAHCQGVFFDGMIISAYNFSSSIEDSIYREAEVQVRHKGYNQNMSVIVDDLMVIKLSESVSEVSPVALNSDPELPKDFDLLYAAGFGLISHLQGTPSELQKVDLYYFSPDICENYYSSNRFENVVFGPGLLCAANRDRAKSVCHGDSGGPLVTDDKRALVGITSFGALCETTRAPNGFSRISYYYDWIQEQICELSDNPPSSCPEKQDATNPDAVAINITLQHDFFAWETTWSVRDKSDNSIQVVGPVNNPSSYSLWYTIITLLPGEYTFELYDMGGNGMAAFAGETFSSTLGWFEVSMATAASTKEVLIPLTYTNFTTVMPSDFVVPEKATEGQTLSLSSVVPPSQNASLRSDPGWDALQATADAETTSCSTRLAFSSSFLVLALFLAT